MSKTQLYYLIYPSWSINVPITKSRMLKKQLNSFTSMLGVTKLGNKTLASYNLEQATSQEFEFKKSQAYFRNNTEQLS